MGVNDLDFINSRMDHDDVGLHPDPGGRERPQPKTGFLCTGFGLSLVPEILSDVLFLCNPSCVVSGEHGQLL